MPQMPTPQDDAWVDLHSEITLGRLTPRIWPAIATDPDADVFLERMDAAFPRLFRLLHALYGDQYDFLYYLEATLLTMIVAFRDRSPALRELDAERTADPAWFRSENMMGAVCYVDRFAGDLAGVRARIPYFRELGLTYLHLMPLFAMPDEKNDGGYAISDYRRVHEPLGTMDELQELATELRENGISLVLDFVFNHTSDEHAWAQAAREGDPEYRDFYFIFPNRAMPDAYERTLREIFPEQDPGSFTQIETGDWVWTTFRRFQWDLNYRNPAVFRAMLDEMLFLANQGVEVLRLDAVAFLWKQMGTACEGLPQAHWIIQAYNAALSVVAPAMIFKSEAIVHPDEVAAYISMDEAQISYNPTLMALLWESLATRDTRLLRFSMQRRFALPAGCAWVNYVRSHDDIGWTFADEDGWQVAINGYDHRQFLNRFYTGRFEGSFARGVPFNYNPVNQDMRISGTAASLAGLEAALEADDPMLVDHALRRLLLIHSVILSAGGIPLLYLGDEIAMLSDKGYRDDPRHADDSRWAHRPVYDWARHARRHDTATPAGWLFTHLERLIALRKGEPLLGDTPTRFIETGNPHVLGYVRGEHLLVLANVTERHQEIHPVVLRTQVALRPAMRDLVDDAAIDAEAPFDLAPYQFMWLK
jgi:amylosucrase